MKIRYFMFLFIVQLFISSEISIAGSRIVSIDWLSEHHQKENYRILDVRDKAEYAKGHIPNAVSLPVSKTFGLAPRTDLVASQSTLQKMFSEAGIDASIMVVVYDSGSFIDAARLVWILEANGHDQVALLDGGYKGWKQANKISTTDIPVVVAKQFIPSVTPQRIATKFSTRLAVDNPNQLLIDARSPEEYQGKVSKVIRKGRIPTAINVPWNKNFHLVDGVLKLRPRQELKELYSNIDPSKRVITYCNKGKQSALTHFILRELNYDVSAYDGSWFEWAQDASLPIETGQ